VDFYNNTLWVSEPNHYAVQLWHYAYNFKFINNIFYVNGGVGGSGYAAQFDYLSTEPFNTWENNILYNTRGGGTALIDDLGGNGNGCIPCQGALETGEPAYNPPPGVMDNSCRSSTPPASPVSYSSAGLSQFRSTGDAGYWFGSESGDTDKWTFLPSFVNSASPSAANLHLRDTDTVAKDSGKTLATVTGDYDQQLRPQGTAYDIGADEAGSGGTPPPNSPPLANAGPDKTTTLNTAITLNGSGTDSDGTIAAYNWVVSPSGCTLTGASTANLTISCGATGTYAATLTVTDNGGATGSDSATVTVTQPADTTPPTPPTNLTGTYIALKEFLKWATLGASETFFEFLTRIGPG
jgi:hypothetical protein